ncbi:sigma-54-dependent Fis family transcriptional regulator [Enterovibrio norvegicus]|uniref:sigma-54-dependent transcriptional regulator n=1 Tax=Enterovibrio norvegicus TaxID=188144 RepID=UPI000C82AAFF|nr:sigma-54 dependent transcriptional regulator [Enterovibrio norvegicus]MCC4797988.1 sigma-54 dependent transcriptional regulator [Enterovibrio norvegicus]PMI34764.1 sigma-54-dependent Fis family transcriptional regulator [Enterovibrio norvegicus]PMN44971.1 sigma-54-dependent Fis family transcriptional regulator [Enterovibrio norvegicus]
MKDALQQFGFSALVVDDEPGMRAILNKALSKKLTQVETASSLEEAEALRKRNHFDLLIVDINLPGRSGIDWHEAFNDDERRSDIIFMTGYAELETAIKALRAGASDFILKPFNLEQMLQSVQRCLDKRMMERRNVALQRDVARSFPVDIIGDTPKTLAMRELVSRLAPSPAAVLIEGESGTGKELVARALHAVSGRNGPFVPLNCGAIAPELLESELFGHVAGAFTGARKSKDGLFRVADRGTLFLDEIGEMPLSMQASLLRTLEQKTIRPVGAEREVNVDVRIVAATNRNLHEEVAAGRFRKDLFYRLNVLSVEIPPLRERVEDIGLLLNHFSDVLARDMGMKPVVWANEEVAAMQQYGWPGNIRELKNTVERAILLGKPDVTQWLGNAGVTVSVQEVDREEEEAVLQEDGYPLGWPLKDVERAHIERVVDAHEGNKSAAARQLGVARKTLERKFKEWL